MGIPSNFELSAIWKSEDETETEEDAEEHQFEELNRQFVAMLLKARQDAGLTQQQLADKLGTSFDDVITIETGVENTTIKMLFKYARTCGKTLQFSKL